MEFFPSKVGDFIVEANPLTRIIKHAADKAKNEAEFRRPVVNELERIAQKYGLKGEFREENFLFDIGRTDANFSHMNIEFKAPGILDRTLEGANTSAAFKKVCEYMDGLYREMALRAQPPDKTQLVGIIIDGKYIVFIRYVSHIGWSAEQPAEVTPASVEKMLRWLAASAYGCALTPENLVRDFGGGTSHAKAFGRTLYDSVQDNDTTLAGCIYRQWKTFFGETCDYEQGSAKLGKKDELKKFCTDMGVPYKGVDVQRLIFAVHTYYAFLIKLIAFAVIVSKKTNGGNPVSDMPLMTSVELHRRLKDLEEGTNFTSYWGIRNFPEDPFFTWYLHTWSDGLAEAVRRFTDTLSDYDPATFRAKPEGARDLLKKLYQYLIPKDIRHDLGEYYTPDWLAELTLDRVGFVGRAQERVLDPACGSGTFLVLAIQRKMKFCRENEKISEETLLKNLLETVKGIDLNPLAVTAARANFIFAIDPLLHYYPRGEEIPIYLADSIYPPKVSDNLVNHNVRTFHTVVGDFDFPYDVQSEKGMSWLAELMRIYVRDGFDFDSFIERMKRTRTSLDASLFENGEVKPENVESLHVIFDKLVQLKKENRDDIWATIIKNAFMPLFLKGFDYIIGNPPWVNWESLPDNYRRETMHLWKSAGLFVHGGMDTILGKGKKDISTLMAFEATRRYLKDGGKLGFVITQSVFKTSGAAQGFRSFKMPSQDLYSTADIKVRVETADDLCDFQPFEGAVNRTAIITWRKGSPTGYPMKQYVLWQKKPRARIRPDMTLAEVKAVSRLLKYHAKPVDAKDPTSSWITARPKALDALKKVLGKSDYQAREGVNTGGANAIYWLKGVEDAGKDPHTGAELIRAVNLAEGAKSGVAQLREPVILEKELVYPLLRGRDVQRWHAKPMAWILMVQDLKTRRGIDVSTMQKQYPHAWSYLKSFETELRQRAAFKRYFDVKADPFYSMFNAGEYTLAPNRVIWPRISSTLDAVFLKTKGVPLAPQETHVLVSFESPAEGHFFCAVFNSTPINLAAVCYSQRGGKSFGSPHILENIRIPHYSNKFAVHKGLSDLSITAHKLAAAEDWQKLAEVEEQIDLAAAKLYGINDEELAEIRRNLRELNKEDMKTSKLFPK